VVGGTGVSHQVRDRGGWGQRHRGGVGKRLRVPPISPGPPHGLGQRPRKGKEPLLRLGRCRGRCRRWSGKEDRLRGGGARGRGTRGRLGPHVDGASPQVVERWSLGTTQRATSAARRATASTLATTTPPPPGGRGGSPRSVVERRGGSSDRSGGEVKLLEKQIVLGLRKGWKGLHASKNGRHTIEARAQATEGVEHEALIGDGGPEGAECPPSSSSDGSTRPQRDCPEQADGRRSRGTGFESGGGQETEPRGHPRSGEQYRLARERCPEVRP
jgi:hypothetical protein